MTFLTTSITLRPATSGDEPLLFRIYSSTREEELAQVPWTADEKETFLRAQFEAQHHHYQEHYSGATFDVVLVDDRPAGRLYVARWTDEIRVVDIALLPEWRNLGIGTRLLTELLDEAAEAGKRLTVHVEKLNPALELYRRLGFEQVADRGVYLLLEARP